MKIVRIANKKDMFKLESNGEDVWYHLKEGKVRDYAIKQYKIGDEIEIKLEDDKVKKGDQVITFIDGKGSGSSSSSSGGSSSGSSETKSYSKSTGAKGSDVQQSIEKQTIIKATAEALGAVDGVTEANVCAVIKDIYEVFKSVSDADEMKVS